MKSLKFIAMAGVLACCMVVLGSQSNAFAQGKSGKSKGKSDIGQMRSTDVIQRGMERISGNRTQRTRTSDRDWSAYGRTRKSKNKKHKAMHTNNGVRDHGRGIGRGKGQGKGRGYAKRTTNRGN